MAVINGYATLTDLKEWMRVSTSNDTDDNALESILEASSRFIDAQTERTFYPRVEVRKYDVPDSQQLDIFDDDLMEVITLTNGSDTEIASTEYIVIPANTYPKWALKIKSSSGVYWQSDSDGNVEQVIDVNAFWGHHKNYSQRGWSTGSTINEGDTFEATDTTMTVTSGTPFVADQLLKVDNEIMRCTAVSTNDLTVVRGENGSTAVYHDDGSTVYIWNPQADIREACLMIANDYTKKRFGQGTTGIASVTAAGVVITPNGIPAEARDIIRRYQPWP